MPSECRHSLYRCGLITTLILRRATVEEDQKDQVESMWKSICWENGREVGIGIT